MLQLSQEASPKAVAPATKEEEDLENMLNFNVSPFFELQCFIMFHMFLKNHMFLRGRSAVLHVFFCCTTGL